MPNNGDHNSGWGLLDGEIIGNSNLRIMVLRITIQKGTGLPTKSETVQCVLNSMAYFKTPNLVQGIEWNGNILYSNHEGDDIYKTK